MKALIIRTNLKEGLSAIERAGGEGSNLPILKNVLIEAVGAKISLLATNLEIAVMYSASGKVIQAGKAAVPMGTLVSVIAGMQTERLNLEVKGSTLEITSDNYRATLQGSPAEDFPLVPRVKTTEYIELPIELLRDALTQVVASAQASDLRPELSSVLFDFSFDELKLAATDSFRLSERSIPKSQFSTTREESFRALVPLKTAHELIRILKGDGSLRLFYDQNQMLFQTDQVELISRLIDGNFPDYGAIIPKKFGGEAIIDRQEFMNALKLASIFGSRTSEVKIGVATSKKALEISSADQAVGENSYMLPAKLEGKIPEVLFNWRYLIDALKILKGEEIFLGVNENGEPSLLRGVKDASYFYIVKPILKA